MKKRRKPEHLVTPTRLYLTPRHNAFLQQLMAETGFTRSGVLRALLDHYELSKGGSETELLIDQESIHSTDTYEEI